MDDQLYNNEERINQYLHGEMSPEEESVFEADIQKDDTLRRQAESMARIVKGMEVVGKEHDKQLLEKMKASSGKKTSSLRWVSIAASIALVFTVSYFVYDYSSTTRLGKEYAYAFPVSEVIRGEEDEDVVNTLTILFDNVANGKDLDNTIKQLEELWALAHSDTYNGYTTHEPYIGWNLAVAHLRNYDKKKARVVLEQMQANYPTGTALGDKIAELLKKV
ncbi:MAG: hypothetical protein IKZ54_02450 [Bacteroidales bacterium]|nr:hypothetical protein [Bacteroidales bacterium]